MLIDVAPSISLFQTCAMVYTQNVLVPVDMDILSVQGATSTIHVCETLNRMLERGLNIRALGMLPVKLNRRLAVTEMVLDTLSSNRPDRQFGPHVIHNQCQQLRKSLRGLEREGIRDVFKLSSPEEVEAATIERQPLWNNRKAEHGPFDIIGDVHGCFDELVELMRKLGYAVELQREEYVVSAPEGRKLAFVGDLVDRGPEVVNVLRLVSGMVRAGQAFCVPGNHDMKLVRALRGRDVKRTHGLAETMEAWNESLPNSALVSPVFWMAWSATMSSMTASWSLHTLA